MKFFVRLCFFAAAIQGLLWNGCTTGVESSPDPGTLRVTVRSNEGDTLLVILGDTIHFSRVDHYDVIFSQGRLYRGISYADLYRSTSIDRITAGTVNLIQRAWLDGRLILPSDSSFDVDAWRSRYVSSTMFEWYVPPGHYDSLEFNLIGIEVFVARPRQFRNPLELAEGTRPIMDFAYPIDVKEGGITEVEMEILPFQSIRRYKDAYIFDRRLRIVDVKYR